MRIFEETQRFNQWWMQLIQLSMLVFLAYCVYQWYVAEVAVDKVAADDVVGQLTVTLAIAGTIALFYLLRLQTTIDEKGVHYRFFPFHSSKKSAHWFDLEQCYTRTYSPITEYGGWGYRWGRKGSAVNVRGNQGIQLVFKNGKKLLIGTQQPEQAQKIINKYFPNERV